jgi:putative transposase
MLYNGIMQVTRTIKLKFLDLNQCKQEMFAEMQIENTAIANELLKVPYIERRKQTTAMISSSLGSALVNQVIRHTISKTGRKVNHFKVLPIEVNKQNWKLTKKGETYSLSFPTTKGEKRVPISVASPHWQSALDGLLEGSVKGGSFKLILHKGKWYAYLSVTEDVPEVQSETRLGCDRGQNNLAVIATKKGFAKFYSGQKVKHIRRRKQKLRTSLQEAGKMNALRKSKKRESRWMTAVNHTISKRIVDIADYLKADVVIEDLSGCRSTMKQRKKTKSNAGQNRDYWAYYQLEQFLSYKLARKGLRLIIRPAPYTSKTSSYNGLIGKRNGHWFVDPLGNCCNSDWNAGRNLAQWDGFACSLDLQRLFPVIGLGDRENAVFDNPLNSIREHFPALAGEV